MKKKNICVVGLGYIGLPTAALLASKGYKVNGVDINESIVSKINKGEIHIIEKDLSALVKLAVKNGKLEAFNKIQKSDIYIICVPTPLNKNSNIPLPNIEYVSSAFVSIASFIKPNDLIILESTSPVGTTERMKKILVDNGANLTDVHIAYCPERVLPGKIITELVENDRIVGGLSPLATKKVADFYRLFVNGKIFETDTKTAEMCKLTENSFRDLNIAFANELSMLCDNQGIDVWKLIKLANKHPRVNILHPGTGVGGHCIAVDPWFIVSMDKKNTKLIRSAREVNDNKTKWVIDKIKNAAIKHISKTGIKPKIMCLGLTFKPDIDDLRESKALQVAQTLLSDGYNILAIEPNIQSYKNLTLLNFSSSNFFNLINEVDIICILVKHKEFLQPKIKNELMKRGAFDFCGVLN